MTTKHPQNADALAEMLRTETASDADLSRIEQGVVRALRQRRTTSSAPRWIFAGVAVAAAAAAWLLLTPEVAPAPIVRVPLPLPPPSTIVPEIPMLAVGAELSHDEARVAHASVSVTEGSLVHVDDDSAANGVITLARGVVHVTFHPLERGAEHLAVVTDVARVEVIGTEFVVTRAESGTHVRVIEGVVRVITIATGEAHELRRGDEIEVAVGPGPGPGSGPGPGPGPGPGRGTAQETGTSAPSIDDLETLVDAQRDGSPQAAVVTATRILELDPHGDHGATALFDRAGIEERELHASDRAADDYARYLADFPTGSFAAQARARLCALDPARCSE